VAGRSLLLTRPLRGRSLLAALSVPRLLAVLARLLAVRDGAGCAVGARPAATAIRARAGGRRGRGGHGGGAFCQGVLAVDAWPLAVKRAIPTGKNRALEALHSTAGHRRSMALQSPPYRGVGDFARHAVGTVRA
jgi:hypothetical protein